MQQLEHELTQTQTNLDQATHNLEEKEKALQNVSERKLCLYYLLHDVKLFTIDLNACLKIIFLAK